MTIPPQDGALESALYAEDLEAAAAFWTGIMGLPEIGRAPGRHVFFRLPGGVLLVFNPRATITPPAPDARLPVPPHGATGPGHFCLAVQGAHLDGWRRHLETAGVAIEADFHWPQGGRSIYFRDPAGNSIELAEPRIWG
ncbi:VOC family protein [Ruixingdingia sedimenti]|uniref:VOC family protein n=1 Tax=Ruixingdingia sedimenti TaxID=3073604 RepID=A0ABU1FF34_9RHOB|nr:VOC family protein [Xinfangfangia sp. LG-4]MDR5655178.1 VOC family protein [Xinfangfangia sp. LG-4]